MKSCSECKAEKPLSEFYKDKAKKDGASSRCKPCSKEYGRRYYEKNSELLRKYSREWYKENRERACAKNLANYYKNIDIRKAKRKKQYWENREENIIKSSQYHLSRIQTDPYYRFKARCRKRVWAAFNERGYSKRTKTFQMIGCDQEFLISHIESQFRHGMTWENYGDWHLDHKVPFSAAENESEVELLCHYLNLQPLWASDNVSKSSKCCPEHKKRKLEMIRRAIEHS